MSASTSQPVLQPQIIGCERADGDPLDSLRRGLPFRVFVAHVPGVRDDKAQPMHCIGAYAKIAEPDVYRINQAFFTGAADQALRDAYPDGFRMDQAVITNGQLIGEITKL